MLRVLVIEDNVDLAEIYRLALTAAGFDVFGVHAEPEGALLSADPASPADLVILDERLGARSGSAFVAPLRKVYPSARFLLVSADPDAVAAARGRGFDEAKRKPVTMSHMVENIRQLLARPGFSAPSGDFEL